MRDDMHRVIITRARFINSVPRKGRVKPIDETPLKRGMRRDYTETQSDKKPERPFEPAAPLSGETCRPAMEQDIFGDRRKVRNAWPHPLSSPPACLRLRGDQTAPAQH